LQELKTAIKNIANIAVFINFYLNTIKGKNVCGGKATKSILFMGAVHQMSFAAVSGFSKPTNMEDFYFTNGAGCFHGS